MFQELMAAQCLARPSCTRTVKPTWATPISTTSTFITRSMKKKSQKASSISTTRSNTKTKIMVRLGFFSRWHRNFYPLLITTTTNWKNSFFTSSSFEVFFLILYLDSLFLNSKIADWIADTSSQVTIGCAVTRLLKFFFSVVFSCFM